MKKTKLAVVGLILLGLLALALSAAAMLRFRGGEAAVPAPAPAASAPIESPSISPQSTNFPSPTPQATTPAIVENPTVVVIGDSFSVGEPETNWIATVGNAMSWGEVVNLSAPGRGYVKKPRSCDLSVCASFAGSVGLIAESEPDIVITFGGTADGDYSLAGPAEEYFDALRAALPDAQLIAVNPITGDDEAAYWLTLHRQAITTAVEAVGGTAVDIGQPALGDGREFTAETQSMIGQGIIDQLSAA